MRENRRLARGLLAVHLLALALVAAGAAAMTGGEPAAVTPKAAPLDYPALAQRIVTALALRPGEKVLLVADPGQFQPIVAPLRAAVIRAGGVDLGCWTVMPPPVGLDRAAVEKAWLASRAALHERLRDVDAAVMLPGAEPSNPEYAAMQEVLREGHGRTVHFHWQGGTLSSAMAVPGQPLPDPAVIDATYQQAALHSDCRAIGAVERRFAAALAAGEVRVTTPEGTDLRFRAGDRPVNLQDGDASAARAAAARVLVDREIEIPCGAVRVAPLEETVEGTIAFPPAAWDGRAVGAVKLRFVHGRVAEVIPPDGPAGPATESAVEAEIGSNGDVSRSFRELALGFNPELAVPAAAPWIPYYGYGAGVLRLSLGDNTELGGRVKGSYVRWNFFTDATVTVGGTTWVRAGRLTAP